MDKTKTQHPMTVGPNGLDVFEATHLVCRVSDAHYAARIVACVNALEGLDPESHVVLNALNDLRRTV